jgi:hypothetical protein
MEICMKNTNMIRFTRGAILAGLVLGSSMAHAWGSLPVQVKAQPSWLSQNKGTIALTTGVVGLAAFLGTTIYKYYKSADANHKGFTGYFGFVWDGTKHYANASKEAVVNGKEKVRRYTWRTKAEKVDDLTAKNDALNQQLADEKDAPKKAELAEKLQPKIKANDDKIAALNAEIKAEADDKAKAEKAAAPKAAAPKAAAPVVNKRKTGKKA